MGLLILTSASSALSYLVGSGVILLNFAFLAGGWWLIFSKKLIALAVFLIVSKYAISGIIIYYVIRENIVDPLWLAIGISSFVATILVYTQRKNGI